VYKWLAALAIIPTVATAQDWQRLDAPAIKLALTARTLAYDGGATQQFNADGSTVYTTDRASTGAWRLDGAQYCSQWPPSDRWSCYTVARSGSGCDLKFTAGDGSESLGHYVGAK
jgi:hypothetical protein